MGIENLKKSIRNSIKNRKMLRGGRQRALRKTVSWVVLTAVMLTVMMQHPQLARFAVPLSVQAEEEIGEYELYAKAAVLLDGHSNRVLHGKNEDMVLPMASTTKIMTCIVTLEQGDLDSVATASAYAASQPKVHLGVRRGEQFVLRDLLYSLMLESHNDAAVVIAEHIGGATLDLPEESQRTVEESKKAVAAFAALMNEKAKELGCENTYYITPNGLDANEAVGSSAPEGGSAEAAELGAEQSIRQHSTTAAELARVMSYCAWESPKKEQFLEITRQRSHSFSDVEGSRSFHCTNHNLFLDQMEGALTGKTGFTNAAGYCYVGALERDGERYVVALLACGWPNNKNWKWADTKLLMKYGLDNYEPRKGTEWAYDEARLSDIPVLDGQTEQLGERAVIKPVLQRNLQAETPLLLKVGQEIEVLCEVEKLLTAPVTEGQLLGSVKYFLGEELLWEETVVAEKEVKRIDFMWCFEQILSKYFIL